MKPEEYATTINGRKVIIKYHYTNEEPPVYNPPDHAHEGLPAEVEIVDIITTVSVISAFNKDAITSLEKDILNIIQHKKQLNRRQRD